MNEFKQTYPDTTMRGISEESGPSLPDADHLARIPPKPVPICQLSPAESPRITGISADHVRMLAEIEQGLPPILVHKQTMRVIDGMHRLRAALLREQETIEARLLNDDRTDLFLLAVTLNLSRGLALSQADRKAAAIRILNTHPCWSDRAIGRLSGLSSKTVAVTRRGLVGADGQPIGADGKSSGRIGRDGKTRPLNAAHGRRLASSIILDNPGASLRDVALAAGISVGTALDVRKRLQAGQDPVPPNQRARETEKARDTPGSKPGHGVHQAPKAAIPHEIPWESCRPLLHRLRKDPSIRFSESGRTMIRLLEMHSMTPATVKKLIDSIPEHSIPAVAKLARSAADFWLNFANTMDNRNTGQESARGSDES